LVVSAIDVVSGAGIEEEEEEEEEEVSILL
jgi:hypothetical protein